MEFHTLLTSSLSVHTLLAVPLISRASVVQATSKPPEVANFSDKPFAIVLSLHRPSNNCPIVLNMVNTEVCYFWWFRGGSAVGWAPI